jgi:PAS domain S-box-containing protein
MRSRVSEQAYAGATRQSLAHLRSRLCNGFLIGFSLVGVPAVAASIWRSAEIGWQPVMGYQAATVAMTILVTLLRQHIPLPARGAFVIGVTILLALQGWLSVGLLSGASLAVLTGSLLAILLFGVPAALLTMAVGMALLATIAVLVVKRLWIYPIDLSSLIYTPGSWINASAAILLAGAAVGVPVSIFIRNLVASLEESDARQDELQRLIRQANAQRDELAESRALLRSIADHLPVGVAYRDTRHRYRFVNATGARWMALSADDIIGRTTQDLFPDVPEARSGFAYDPRQGGKVTWQGRIRFGDGSDHLVQAEYIPLQTPGGDPAGYVTLLTDTTEREAEQERLRQAQRVEAVGQLTGGVAHDFNNLLAVIIGNLELVTEDLNISSEVRMPLQSALQAAKRGASLTRSLLAFARRQPLAPVSLDAAALVDELGDLIRRTTPANIQLSISKSPGTWPCQADPGQLQNALLNLVSNGRDAMPNGGRIEISVSNAGPDEPRSPADPETGDYVLLTVTDTGTGMAPDVASRAMEPFFTTKEVGRGTGLGLSMVYGFAKQSGGHFRIISELGRGTQARLYLPRAQTAAPPAPNSPSEPAAASSAVDHRRRSILVVEDDADLRALLSRLLEGAGFTVLACSNATEAVEVVSSGKVLDLLLTDMVLPGEMNGWQLGDTVRRTCPGLPVMYMSGYSEEALARQANSGETGILYKPFTRAQLLSQVNLALGLRLQT